MTAPEPEIVNPIDVIYAARQSAAISAEVINSVFNCPVVQLFVVSRSGSVLVHSLLDSHPEVLDIPHVFKFYDFVLACNGFTNMEVAEIAEKFVTYDQHKRFFDSALSVHIGGRLGDEMRHHIVVDRNQFKLGFMTAMLEILQSGRTVNIRSIFTAFLIAYNWCLGKDLSKIKVIFHHLHHGDWLCPELLIDKHNVSYPHMYNASDILKADKYIITMRDPFVSFASVCNYGAQVAVNRGDEIRMNEIFLHLLLQDWSRLNAFKQSNDLIELVAFEDIRHDSCGVMKKLCKFMDIDNSCNSLKHSTFYGLTWHGDIFSNPTTVPGQGAKLNREQYWQDNVLIDYAVGSIFEKFSYARFKPSDAQSVNESLENPSPRLLEQPGEAFIAKAQAIAVNRFDFARILRQGIRAK